MKCLLYLFGTFRDKHWKLEIKGIMEYKAGMEMQYISVNSLSHNPDF